MELDQKLSFQKHAKKKLKQCWFEWYKITKNCSRFWGLNVSFQVILFKTPVLTKLLYAAPIWLRGNIEIFKKFLTKVCLKISGATHYPSQSLIQLAAGLEPLTVQLDVIVIKFTLKALFADDNMRSMLLHIGASKDHPFHEHIVLVKKYRKPEYVSQSRVCLNLSTVNVEDMHYQKADIDNFEMHFWKEQLRGCADNKLWYLLSLFDMSDIHISVSNFKVLFSRFSKRSTDTHVMDLLHGHSLHFGSFEYVLNKQSDPNCRVCGV